MGLSVAAFLGIMLVFNFAMLRLPGWSGIGFVHHSQIGSCLSGFLANRRIEGNPCLTGGLLRLVLEEFQLLGSERQLFKRLHVFSKFFLSL